MSALSELLNSKPVSARQAAEKAEEIGIDLPYGTIAAYWTDSYIGRPTAKTLKKLAAVVPFSEKQLQEAAWSASSTLGPWVPPEESILLDRHVRKALDSLVKAVVAAKGASNVVEVTQEPSASPEGDKDEKTVRLVSDNPEAGTSLKGKPLSKDLRQPEPRQRLRGMAKGQNPGERRPK